MRLQQTINLLVNGSEFASVLGRVVHEAGHGWQEVDGVRHPAELPPRVVPARRSQNGYMKGRSMLMLIKVYKYAINDGCFKWAKNRIVKRTFYYENKL